MKNAINWFEIPASDFDRAKKFYEALYKTIFQTDSMGGGQMAFFPYDQMNGIGGCVIRDDTQKPSSDGCTVYLNGGEDLSKILARVENAGGEVLTPKTSIGEHGFIAFFLDTEGNRIGIHSMK